MKIKIIGFWQESGWKGSLKNIDSVDFSPKNTYEVQEKVLNYLSAGVFIFGLRTNSICIFSNEDIGSPTVYTDGEFAWTNEYIHYLKNGYISINKDLLIQIKKNNYICPSRDDIGIHKLIAIGDLFQDKSSLTYL